MVVLLFAAGHPPQTNREALRKKMQGVAKDLFVLTLPSIRAVASTAITDPEKVQVCFFLFFRLQEPAEPAKSEP